MPNTKFSVIIPVYNRELEVIRTINSLKFQSFTDYEVIFVNDASTDNSIDVLREYQRTASNKVLIINHTQRTERVACRNEGMKAAQGDWICWLDSDDEYMSNYLELLADAINVYPEYKLFNFGSIVFWHRKLDEFGTSFRPVFKPEIEGDHHVNFKSGHIGTGQFIFNREVLQTIPLMVACDRPYGDSGCFPEVNRNPNYPMRDDGQWVPMGNPWGDDYMWWWKMTRQFISKPLDMYLYIEHKR